MKKIKLKQRMNKKAQIGTTITWFVAFVIIFFIMLLFVSATATLAAKKLTIDKNKIESEEIGGKLKMQRTLMLLLNTPIEFEGQKIPIRDFIIKSKKQKIEDEIKNFINSLEPKPDCYIIRGDNFEVQNLFGLGGRRYSRAFVDSFLKEEGSEINLTNNGQTIKLNYYIGKC